MTLEDYLRNQPGVHFHGYATTFAYGLTLVLVPFYDEVARPQAFAVSDDTATPLTEPKESHVPKC